MNGIQEVQTETETEDATSKHDKTNHSIVEEMKDYYADNFNRPARTKNAKNISTKTRGNVNANMLL